MIGTVSLSVVVMTHPRRLDHAQTLAAALRPHPVDIVLDPDPDGPPESLRTAVHAWAAAGDATHHLVMQDDVVVTNGFIDHVLQDVVAFPEAALAYFAHWSCLNGAAVRLGALLGVPWVEAIPEWTPCLALVLPRRVALGFAEFGLFDHHESRRDDNVMQLFLTSKGVPTYLSVPCLVEHAPMPSLLGHDPKGARKAACFLGDRQKRSPDKGADPPLTFSAIPYFSGGQALCSLPNPSPNNRLQRTRMDGESYLTSLDVPMHRVRVEFDRVLSLFDHETQQTAVKLGEQTLWQLWITTYAMGCTARQSHGFITGQGNSRQTRQRSLSRNAMATVAVGGLTPTSGLPNAEKLSWQLRHFCHAGFTAGTTDPAIAARFAITYSRG
jgi:hypothetical protein